MHLVQIYKGEDKVISLRLFDCLKQDQDLHLNTFNDFIFNIYEKGQNDPIIQKKMADIVLTSEVDGSPANIVNIRIKSSDTSNLKPNPITFDKVRTFVLFGIDAGNNKIFLEAGFIYVDDLAASI